MANRILIRAGGTVDETVSKQVTTALNPGVIVKIASGKFAVAGAGDDKERLFVLNGRSYRGTDLNSAYTADDVGDAYEILPSRCLQVRVANATYTEGTAVSVAANGGIATAASGDRVIGYIDATKTTTASDPFVNVAISQGAVA